MKIEDAVKEVIASVICMDSGDLDCKTLCPFYREGTYCADRDTDAREAILLLRKTFNI